MPLFWLSLAFLGGVWLAAGMHLPLLGWLALAALAVCLLLLRWIARRFSVHLAITIPGSISEKIGAFSLPVPVLALLALLALGAARYQGAQPGQPSPGRIAYYNDTKADYLVEGVLSQPPDVRDGFINLRVSTERLRPVKTQTFIPVEGGLLARIVPGGDWHYGDRISLQGQLATPPEEEDFSYRDYLAHQGVYSYIGFARAKLLAPAQGNPLMSWIYTFRERGLNMVYRLYPDPEASLLMEATQLHLSSGDNCVPSLLKEATQLRHCMME